jgi:hypothetical protein
MTGDKITQSEIHASLQREGPTRKSAQMVHISAGGNVTMKPKTIIMPGWNGGAS